MQVSVQLFILTALPSGKSSRFPLDRRLGGPHDWSGLGDEEKEIPAASEDSNQVLRSVA